MVRRRSRPNALIEVATAHALTSELFDREAARRGLPPAHVGLLTLVHLHGPVTPTVLEYESGLPPTTLRERIHGLELDGYVHRIANDADRRSYFLDTTPEGERFLAACEPALRAVERRLARELGMQVEEYRAPLERLRLAAQKLLAETEEPAPPPSAAAAGN